MTKYFSREHEWIDIQNNSEALVGITSYAVEQLGDIVFVELPAVGKSLEAGKECAVIESVKAASEVYSPMSGEVLDKNEELESSPDLLNKDSTTWFLKIKLSCMDETEALMDETTYNSYVTSLKS